MKKFLLMLADLLAKIWRLLPRALRHRFIEGMMILESRGVAPAQGLRDMFDVEDRLRRVVNERGLALGNGIHPKHRLMTYHRFFAERVRTGENVLDVGCSYGEVARKLAADCPQSKILGMDYDEKKLNRAREISTAPNLSYMLGDATKTVPEGVWHVVVLSNVLEHISDRVVFLTAIRIKTGAQKILIRVPHFERDWTMPMRRELGVNYYSDDDHKIEHTIAEFEAETRAAGLVIQELHTPWGEIWASLTPTPA